MTLVVLLLGTPFLVASVQTILSASEQNQLQERKSMAKRALNRLSRELQGRNPRSSVAALYEQSGLDDLGVGATLVDRDGTVLWESPSRAPRPERRGVQQFRLNEGALLYVMPERPPSGNLAGWVFAIAGVGVVVYGVGAWLSVGATLKPVSKLVDRVNEVKSGQGSSVSAPSTDTEIVRLVETLNALIDEVRSESDERVKSYATLSHELRTPIHALLLELDLALGSEQTKEQLESTLVGVQRQVYRLNRLSEAVLTLQGLTQPEALSTVESLDLAEAINRVFVELQPLFEVRSLVLAHHATHGYMVQALPQHIDLLLRNLLENAAKFAPVGSEVQVYQRVEGARVELEIVNRSEEGRQMAGNGLGLRICREIARVNRWEFETMESQGEHRVKVRFPDRHSG